MDILGAQLFCHASSLKFVIEREIRSLAGDRFDKELYDSLKDANGYVTKDRFLFAAKKTEREAQEMFDKFCPTGEMDSKAFNKLCRDAGLMNNSFTSGDADLIFSSAKTKADSASKTISYELFRYSAVPGLALKKGITEEQLLVKIGQCNGPRLNNATKADNVRLFDDKTTYTGSYSFNGHGPSDSAPSPNSSIPAGKFDTLTTEQLAEVHAKRASLTQSGSEIYRPDGYREPETKQQFGLFCPDNEMDSKTFVKFCRDTKLFDSQFRVEDADILFLKAKTDLAKKQGSTSKGIRFNGFRMVCIPAIANKKGVSIEDVLELIATAEGPKYTATKAEQSKLHEEKKAYGTYEDPTAFHKVVGRSGSAMQANVGESAVSRRPSLMKGAEGAASRRASHASDARTVEVSASAPALDDIVAAAAAAAALSGEPTTALASLAAPSRRSSAAPLAAPLPAADDMATIALLAATTAAAIEPAKRVSTAGPSRRSSAVQALPRGSGSSTAARRTSHSTALTAPGHDTGHTGHKAHPTRSGSEAVERVELTGPQRKQLHAVFLKFAPTGEMKSAQFVKMMRDSDVLNDRVSSGDAEVVFTKAKQICSGGGSVAAGQKVPFDVFVSYCVPTLARKRGDEVGQFAEKLGASNGPVNNGTVADYNKLHDEREAEGTPTITHTPAGL